MKRRWNRVLREAVMCLPFCSSLMALVYGKKHRDKSISGVFEDIYHTGAFKGRESLSGPGSDLEETVILRSRIPELFSQFNVRTVIDAPCGDLNWMRYVVDYVEHYIGADIVPDLIDANRRRYVSENVEFLVADITKDVLPRGDIIMCRDCFVHLPFSAIGAALKNFKASGSTYLLTTTYPLTKRHVDIIPGLWRPLNLELKPFGFPPPLLSIDEKSTQEGGLYSDKMLALWKLEDLPIV